MTKAAGIVGSPRAADADGNVTDWNPIDDLGHVWALAVSPRRHLVPDAAAAGDDARTGFSAPLRLVSRLQLLARLGLGTRPASGKSRSAGLVHAGVCTNFRESIRG